MVTTIIYGFLLIAFAAHGLRIVDTKPKHKHKHNHKHFPSDDKVNHTDVSQVRPDVQAGKVNHSVVSQIRGPYSKLPNFTLMSRVYVQAEEELSHFLLPSYKLFWPSRSLWPNSRLTLIWDEENRHDHEAANRTRNMFPFVKNMFEKKPAPGTLCSKMRSEGYARQQYSNFLLDQILDGLRDDEYVGIADADTFFTTAVLPEELFDWDAAQGKWIPRVFGYNSCCVDWMKTTARVIQPKERAGQFMTLLGFPVIFKVEHLKLIRSKITQKGGFASPSWDESFRKICDTGTYSQFDIMMNVLWNSEYHREYSWYLRDQRDAQSHSYVQGRVSHDKYTLSKNDFHRPRVGMMEHSTHKKTTKRNAFEYVCNYDHLNPLHKTVRNVCSGLTRKAKARMKRDRFVDALSNAVTGTDNSEIAPSQEAMSQSWQEHMDRVYFHKEAFPWLK